MKEHWPRIHSTFLKEQSGLENRLADLTNAGETHIAKEITASSSRLSENLIFASAKLRHLQVTLNIYNKIHADLSRQMSVFTRPLKKLQAALSEAQKLAAATGSKAEQAKTETVCSICTLSS